jgi:hypothetical protein
LRRFEAFFQAGKVKPRLLWEPSFLLLGIEMILHPQPIGDGARHRRCNKAQGGAAWRLERWRQQRPNRGYVSLSLSIDHDTAPLAVNATWRSAGS